MAHPYHFAEPIMTPPSVSTKSLFRSLVTSALSREGWGDLPPMPAYYAPKRWINRPSPAVKSAAIRMLTLEASMYPSYGGLLFLIEDDEYSRKDLDEWWQDVSKAFQNAERMLKGTDDVLRKQKLLGSENNGKNYGTQRQFQKGLKRFDLAKQLVQQEVEKAPSQMPQKSCDFLGSELAKYHELYTEFRTAQRGGTQKLRSFFITNGYATEARYQESIRTLNRHIDNYYRFHKKTLEDIKELDLSKRRKRWLELDRGRARSHIMRERLLTDKGKELLHEAVKTDDAFLRKYVRITTSGTPTWHANLQAKRESKLADLMTEYIDKQAENSMEANESESGSVQLGEEEIDEADFDGDLS